jgi:hypothetical protein
MHIILHIIYTIFKCVMSHKMAHMTSLTECRGETQTILLGTKQYNVSVQYEHMYNNFNVKVDWSVIIIGFLQKYM